MFIFQYLRSWKIAVPLGLAAVMGLGVFFSTDEASEGALPEVYKTVELARADQFMNIPVVSTTLGTVESDHEVEIRAETSGRIVSIGVKNGDVLGVGQVLLELDHQILDAQMLQSEARLASARAQLAKLRNGERPEDIAILEQQLIAAGEKLKEMKNGAPPVELALIETQIMNARKNLEEAQKGYLNAQNKVNRDLQAALKESINLLQVILATQERILGKDLQSIIYTQSKPSFDCKLLVKATVNDSIESSCEDYLERFEQNRLLSQSLDYSMDTVLLLEEVVKNLELVKVDFTDFQDFLFRVFDMSNSIVAFDRDINTFSITTQELEVLKSSIVGAQTVVENLVNQLATQMETINMQIVINQTTLDNAQSAVTQAENSLSNLEKEYAIKKAGAAPEQIVIQQTQIRQLELQLEIAKNGARDEDILGQQAQVKQAEADLAVAVANRNKAIITSPLKGTVLQLPFEVGDYVNVGESLARVANREVLEVKTYITEKEKDLVLVGGNISAEEGKIKGVVEEVSPALELETKKIEVLIRLTEGYENLVLGQTVFVNFESRLPENTLRVPLSSVRIIGEEAFVFTVDEDGLVKSLPVTVGTLLEDTIIVSGVNADQLIVVDILGIKDGEKVHSSSTL
jgi:RND family efflux transporter MFP subunit